MASIPQQNLIYQFGPFHLDTAEQTLSREGKLVALTGKAFQTLLVLVENSGHTVTKDNLLTSVWPDTFVEELTLAQNISTVRKALGDDKSDSKYIQTVPRRGYRFVAPVIQLDESQAQAPTNISATEEQLHSDDAADVSHRRQEWQSSRLRWAIALVGLSVLAVAVGIYLFRANTRNVDPGAQVKSIAVLPFQPLTGGDSDEALQLGMADALITKLSNIKQIVVRPTSSILKYSSATQDPLVAGREQMVDSLLEGKVQRSGERIRITVQLIRVSDGKPLWADTFDETFTNIFAVQDSISQQVAQRLVAQLTGEEQRQLAKRYTDNTKAYQFYLKGRFFWNKFDEEGLNKAIDYFKQAIAIDPNYALAYTGLSVSYNVQGAIGVLPPAQTWTDARWTAEKAVALDDNLAEGHSALGGVKLLYEWDWPAADKELKRAIELNPNSAEAHELSGYYYWVTGQLDTAIAELRRAQELSPLAAIITLDVAQALYYKGRYDEALEMSMKARELDPDFPPPLFLPGQAYERKGMYTKAITECESAIEKYGRQPQFLATLGFAYGASGKRREAEGIVNELETSWRGHYFSPVNIALVHTALGNKDRAFFWLSKGVEGRDPQMIWLRIEPQFESIHADPRFQALFQRMEQTKSP
jgi:DNA-binding winged helix-turn-helix (wHTH) protein/TolB-like protein/tetratricopeptide (TPR) repeat protein